MSEQYVLIAGNPVDGMTFTGPFDEVEAATKWAENHHVETDWWLAPLVQPDVTMYHVNVYERHRNYGGAEEGGWWFDSGVYQPMKSVTMHGTPEEVNAYALRLQEALNHEADAAGIPAVHSVAYTGGRYTVQTDDKPGADWPVERPHYE